MVCTKRSGKIAFYSKEESYSRKPMPLQVFLGHAVSPYVVDHSTRPLDYECSRLEAMRVQERILNHVRPFQH